jgi:DNA polymerase-3 subunit epsilon
MANNGKENGCLLFYGGGTCRMEFTAIDFETANEKRASACAIGIVLVSNGEIIEQTYHLIRPPQLYFNPINISIHGITENDVFDKPTFSELWPSIKHYFENRLVIAHNASFDMSVLRSTLDYYSIPYPELSCGCTLIMSRKHWPDRKGYGLNLIVDLLNIEFQHHNALEDSLACAQIALHILNGNKANSFKELPSALGFSYGSLFPGGYQPGRQSICVRPITRRSIVMEEK